MPELVAQYFRIGARRFDSPAALRPSCLWTQSFRRWTDSRESISLRASAIAAWADSDAAVRTRRVQNYSLLRVARVFSNPGQGMSLSIAEDEGPRSEHPVDTIEQVARSRDWPFERDGEDEITLTVGGGWADYHVSCTWLEDVEALHLACAFDIKLNDRRGQEILKLITLINEHLWIGHFGVWEKQNMIIFRHAMLLTGGAQPSALQCEAQLEAALAACERYYQSFQFVLWAGKTAREALEGALFETVGEA